MKARESEFYRSYVESSGAFRRLDFLHRFLTVLVDDVYCDIIDDLHDQLDAFSEWAVANVDDLDNCHPVELWAMYRERNSTPRFPSLKLRALVLERFNYCCTGCGSTDKLCIDHIFPWIKGGKTVYNNLTVLCEKCNLQKSSKA